MNFTCCLKVLAEIVCGPVGAADALHPYVGGEQLCVPAVAGVVRHLVGHVLPEPEPGRVDTDLDQEELDARHEVAQGLVGNSALKETEDLSNSGRSIKEGAQMANQKFIPQ